MVKTTQTATAQSPATRGSRQDGIATRAHTLDIAGQVFAEKGYNNTTSKEICERAGINMAAVNYHFGGKDGLYEAVLVEAHQQIVGVAELSSLLGTSSQPEEKLKALLARVLSVATRPTEGWGVRVILRELMSPSAMAPVMLEQEGLPKAQLVMGLLAQILELPVHHPAVQHSLILVILPCTMLLMAPRSVVNRMFPAVEQHPQQLVDDMTSYALAGLRALRDKHR